MERVCSQRKRMLMARTCAFAIVGPSPYHLLWPSSCVYLEMACATTRSLHQAATAKYMHTAGHHYCLPWYLATGLGGATEDPTGVVALVDHLPCLPRTTEWMLWTLVTWAKKTSRPPGSKATAQLHMWHPVALALWTCMSPTIGKRLSLKSVHKVWKKWLLLQIHENVHKIIEIMKNQRNMTPLKEYSKPPVIGPKEMEIQEFPTKNSK